MALTTLCYIKKAGKTLMLHRVKKQKDIHLDKWNGLGGHMEQGETPEECVIREVYEESGLTVKSLFLRGVLTFPLFDGFEDDYVFVFIATDFEGKMIDSPEGNLEWIDDSEVLNLNLWEGDKIFLQWLEDGRFFSGKLVYENGRLVGHAGSFY